MQRHVAVNPREHHGRVALRTGPWDGCLSAPFAAQPCIVCVPLAVPTRAFFFFFFFAPCLIVIFLVSCNSEQQAAFALVLSGILLFLFFSPSEPFLLPSFPSFWFLLILQACSLAAFLNRLRGMEAYGHVAFQHIAV